ncbi:hypothetical protein OROMI_012183 [Orobanche minor]
MSLDPLSKITEMRLVPSNPDQLDTLFNIFCECAELNPERVEVQITLKRKVHGNISVLILFSASVGGESDWISHDPIHTIGTSNGDHDLANNVLQLQINDNRFQDAEEMDDDKE